MPALCLCQELSHEPAAGVKGKVEILEPPPLALVPVREMTHQQSTSVNNNHAKTHQTFSLSQNKSKIQRRQRQRPLS